MGFKSRIEKEKEEMKEGEKEDKEILVAKGSKLVAKDPDEIKVEKSRGKRNISKLKE